MRRTLPWIPVLALLTACAASAPPAEEDSTHGLVRVQSTNVDTLYTAPGMTLARYQRVMLDSVQVEFKADWQKRHPDIAVDDVTRIRSQAGAAFRDIFGSALSSNGGFGLTTQAGADVLRVSTTISELEIEKSPSELNSLQRSYVVSSHDLKLLLELRDAESGALLVRAIDHDQTSGDMHVTDSVSNSPEARRTLEQWAGQLRKVLDEARAAR